MAGVVAQVLSPTILARATNAPRFPPHAREPVDLRTVTPLGPTYPLVRTPTSTECQRDWAL